MRRAILLVAAVTLAAVLFPATAAAPPKVPAMSSRAAEGTWSWVNTTWDQWKTTAKGGAYASGTEAGTWTGTFEGTAVETFGAYIAPDGTVWALIEIAFEGTVEGMHGTLQILTTAVLRNPDGTMHGDWTIISGTDELANLRGQGTWTYEGADPADHAGYSGIIKEFIPPTHSPSPSTSPSP
jgi:hypothetical protein